MVIVITVIIMSELSMIYSLQIDITDPDETKTITLQVEIVITVDDALPSFQQNTFSFSLREDDEDGTELGDLGATDEGENTQDTLLCHSED